MSFLLLGMEWSSQGIHGQMAQITSRSARFNQGQASHRRWYLVKIRKEPFGGMPIVTGHGPLCTVPSWFCQLKEPPIHFPSLMAKKLLYWVCKYFHQNLWFCIFLGRAASHDHVPAACWYDADQNAELEYDLIHYNATTPESDAYTINGFPGDLVACSSGM